MTSWTIKDSRTTELSGFDPTWLPDQAYAYVTPRRFVGGADSRVALDAGPYVGLLPLRNGDTLYIAPRIGQESVSRMLLVTARLEDSLDQEFDQLALLGQQENDPINWIHLLGRSFARRLREIEKSSLRFDRQWKTERTKGIKGRVNISATLIGVARHELLPVRSLNRNRTYETPEHRVLGAAAGLLLSQNVIARNDLDVVHRWYNRFGTSPGLVIDLRRTVRKLNAGHFAGPRSYYIPALAMAQLILLQGGIVLSDHQAIESEALLTNVNLLFERYIRVTLHKQLSDQGYTVEKLETGVPSLFTDLTTQMKPDVIIRDRKQVRLLVDAKYKPDSRIDASDHYQMAAYLRGFQVSNGIIVRPNTGYGPVKIVTRHLTRGGTIHELTINLADWAGAERDIANVVTQVLAGSAEA